MSERFRPNAALSDRGLYRDEVCINTSKIYDSCRDKDCISDVRVFFTACHQELVDRAISVKCRKAEIIWVFTDVEAVPFNKGCFSIDLTYFFKVNVEVFTGIGRPKEIEGLCVFSKKIMLFCSEGNAKIFGSRYKDDGMDPQLWQKTNLPVCTVEVVEPIALSAKVVEDCCDCNCGETLDFSTIPESICQVFGAPLVVDGEEKKVLVTLGVFSIVRLERDVQLLIPASTFCIPEKECVASSEENPCDLFRKIRFPLDEFFPPDKGSDFGECARKKEDCHRRDEDGCGSNRQ